MEHVLCKQLLRSGTSVCGMIREFEYAESKNDFDTFVVKLFHMTTDHH